MRKNFIIFLIFITSILTFSQNIEGLNIKDIKTGKSIKLKDIKGKTYIKVWATWCHYCTDSLKDLSKLSSIKGLGYNVISIVTADGVTDINEADFKDYLKYDVEYSNIKIYSIKAKDLKEILNINGYPTNIFLNSKKEVIRTEGGLMKNYEINKIMVKIK